DPLFLHRLHRLGIEAVGLDAGAVYVETVTQNLFGETFRHLTPAGVAGTKEIDRLFTHSQSSLRCWFIGQFLLEVPTLEPESHVDQTDQDRNLDQWTDDSGKGSPGVNTKDSDSNSNRQFKVVARRGKGERDRLGVIRADLFAHVKGHEEHHDKVDHQRNRNSDYIQRQLEDHSAFQ